MAKITRTFRFEQELFEKFDKAAAAAGVDKTKVLTKAIEKFIAEVEFDMYCDTDDTKMVNYKNLWLSYLYYSSYYEMRLLFRRALKKLEDRKQIKQLFLDVFEKYGSYRRDICNVVDEEIKAVQLNKKFEDVEFELTNLEEDAYVVVIYDIENDDFDPDEDDKLAYIRCEDIHKIYEYVKLNNPSEIEVQKKVLELAYKVK